MERIFAELLPQARKWSLILFIVLMAILFPFSFSQIKFFSTEFNIDGFRFLGTLIALTLKASGPFFLFIYSHACQSGIKEKSQESLEEVCRWQKNIFILYSMLFVLLLFFVGSILFKIHYL